MDPKAKTAPSTADPAPPLRFDRVLGDRWAQLSPAVRLGVETLLAALLAFAAFAVDSGILGADLRKPTCFLMSGDGLYFAAMHFKGTLDGGFYLHNAFVGFPYGASLEDFPAPDLVYLGFLKLFTVLTHNWALTWNLMVMLGYPLAGAAAFAVVRGYGLRLVPSLLVGVLYALLPFHQYRLYGHITIGFSYGLTPLALVPAIEIARGSPILVAARDGGRVVLALRDRTSIGVLLLSLFAGLWGFVYFAFFAIAVCAMASVVMTIRTRSVLPLLRGVIACGLATAAFALQNLPVIVHLHRFGRPPIMDRQPQESEIFALKLFEMLVPTSDHRVAALRSFRVAYDRTAPLVNENITAYLGFAAGVGFLVLLAVLFAGLSRPRRAKADHAFALLWPLAMLNALAFFLGTMGGFGSFVAYAGFPQMRSYNRISVVIGFFGLFALAVLLDALMARAKRWPQRLAVTTGIAVLGVLAVFDQTFRHRQDFTAEARAHDADHAFVGEVESKLRPGAAVLQLPYQQFPDGGPVEAMADFSHLVGYLHSKTLRYSYGPLRGRMGDERYRELAGHPPEEMADAAVLAGFDAVWLDGRGFKDGGVAMTSALEATLGPPVVTREAIRVWSLEAHGAAVRARLGAAFESRARALSERPFIGFNDGFHLREHDAGADWVFAKNRSKAFITNPTNHPMALVLSFDATAALPEASSELVIDGPLASARMPLDGQRRHFEQRLEVPPGTHVVTFRTDIERPERTAVDWRERAFVLNDPVLRAP